MANRKQLIILGAYAASQYFFNVIKQLESDNDSGSEEELVQELINIEVDLKIRGKKSNSCGKLCRTYNTKTFCKTIQRPF